MSKQAKKKPVAGSAAANKKTTAGDALGRVIQYKRQGGKLVATTLKKEIRGKTKAAHPTVSKNHALEIKNLKALFDESLYSELVKQTLQADPSAKILSFKDWCERKASLQNKSGISVTEEDIKPVSDKAPLASDLNPSNHPGIIEIGDVKIEIASSSLDMYRQYQNDISISHPGQTQITFTEFCMKHLPKMFLGAVEEKFKSLSFHQTQPVPKPSYDVLSVVKAWGYADNYPIGNTIRLIAEADPGNLLQNLQSAILHLGDVADEIEIEINKP